MEKSAYKTFDEISGMYFKLLKNLEDSYFMRGEAIHIAKRNGQDKFYLHLLHNEYVCLRNVKYLINVFRFLAGKPRHIDATTVPLKLLDFYTTTVKGMIKYSKKVTSINTMESELYLSNPSDSGFVDILNIFSSDLNHHFVKGVDVLGLKNEPDAYLFDIAVGIMAMIDTIRILLVNGAYTGPNKNKYLNVSIQLSKWFDSTMLEIKEMPRVDL